MRRWAAVIAVGLGLVGLSACGGTSKGDFVKKADKSALPVTPP